ncbi:MAG TPA: N-acetyltransferase [Firmicutes bacterium]|jgi:RimJ/RimL family protein N-acetyltransferase|nr:N-acetyltransferase [Bacillota bacterium]
MELIGSNIQLRPLQIRDLPRMVLWNRDAEIQTFVDCTLPDNLIHLERWYTENVPERHYQIFAIETRDGYLIGDMELDHICWTKREAELRIRIGEKEFWGKGFGSEAVRLILDYVFRIKNFGRIYLRVYSFNKRAIQCYIKNGFKPIGVLSRSEEGWKDIILMELKEVKYQKLLTARIAG